MAFLTRWWGGSSDPQETTSLPIPSPPQPSSQANGSPSSSSPSNSPNSTDQLQPPSSSQQRNQRVPTNLKLLLGGLAFFTISSVITRRSLTRRRLASIPPFYTGSTYFKPDINGGMEAFEALNIATINVISFAIMAAGGTMCAFDINTVEDLRTRVRGGLELNGKSDGQVDAELEEWVASVLQRRDWKSMQTVLEKEAEREEARKEKEKKER